METMPKQEKELKSNLYTSQENITPRREEQHPIENEKPKSLEGIISNFEAYLIHVVKSLFSVSYSSKSEGNLLVWVKKYFNFLDFFGFFDNHVCLQCDHLWYDSRYFIENIQFL